MPHSHAEAVVDHSTVCHHGSRVLSPRAGTSRMPTAVNTTVRDGERVIHRNVRFGGRSLNTSGRTTWSITPPRVEHRRQGGQRKPVRAASWNCGLALVENPIVEPLSWIGRRGGVAARSILALG